MLASSCNVLLKRLVLREVSALENEQSLLSTAEEYWTEFGSSTLSSSEEPPLISNELLRAIDMVLVESSLLPSHAVHVYTHWGSCQTR